MLAKLSGRLRVPRAAPAAAATRRLLQEKAGGNASAERKKTFGEEDDPSRFRFTAPLNARKKGRALPIASRISLVTPRGRPQTRKERDNLFPSQVAHVLVVRERAVRRLRQSGVARIELEALEAVEAAERVRDLA